MNDWLAVANGTALLQEIARLAAIGDLRISSITPPGAPDAELTIVLRSSSPTAFAELGDVLRRDMEEDLRPGVRIIQPEGPECLRGGSVITESGLELMRERMGKR